MKAETIYYMLLTSVRFSGKQMQAITDSWHATWEHNLPYEQMTEEDCLIEVQRLGFIDLPEGGWSAK